MRYNRGVARKTVSRGVSRAEWVQAALEILNKAGVEHVTIHRLARDLGISRSGFYWHFENRDELLRVLLDFWSRELTEVITKNVDVAALDPKSRLEKAAQMVLDHDLARYELAIRHWALSDKGAARAVRSVNSIRIDFIRASFAELGFSGDDLEMRAMLFTCYTSLESPMFVEISRKQRRALIGKRVDLLTRRQADLHPRSANLAIREQ